MTLFVGGNMNRDQDFVGIHWHADPDIKVEYQAADQKRTRIARVRVTRPDGTQKLYTSGSETDVAVNGTWRTMDCSDCHNRVAHQRQTAEEAVDALILTARVPGGLPEVKQAALASIQQPYATLTEARSGIRENLRRYYADHHPGLGAADLAAIPPLAELLFTQAYSPNVSPELKVDWETYPDHLGHQNGAGCFRCHAGEHVAADGEMINPDCGYCHSVLLDGVRESQIDTQLRNVIFAREEADGGAPGSGD